MCWLLQLQHKSRGLKSAFTVKKVRQFVFFDPGKCAAASRLQQQQQLDLLTAATES